MNDSNLATYQVGDTTYYGNFNDYNDLAMVNGYLVNISSHTIRLNSSFSDITVYPYISCSAYQACRLYSRSGDYVLIQDDLLLIGDKFKTWDFSSLTFLLLFAILLLMIVRKKF